MRQEHMAEIPQFRTRKVERNPARLIGDLSDTHYGSEVWVKPGWLGDLRVRNRFVVGRWSKVGSQWAFTPKDAAELESLASINSSKYLTATGASALRSHSTNL